MPLNKETNPNQTSLKLNLYYILPMVEGLSKYILSVVGLVYEFKVCCYYFNEISAILYDYKSLSQVHMLVRLV